MSFNTRSGRGRALQQSQVSYHQTPPRLQPNPAAFGNQYQQLLHPLPYTPAPTPAAVVPAPAQPSPPGVAPQPLPQEQQALPSTPQQFKMMQHVKMEAGTPSASPLSTQPLASAPQTTEKDAAETRPWKKLKNPSFKVNKVQKRRRLNARFRKLLFPKNAIMVLNELQPGVVFDASESTNAFSQTSYHVKIEVDGEKYTGEGSSKASAKAAAAELAVKGIILKKIAESSKKDPAVEEQECMDVDDDASDKSSLNGRRVIPEDEVPWGSLASFALFKLFAEWKTQGSVIPPVITPPLGKPVQKNSAPKNKAPATAAAAAAIAAGVAASVTYSAPPTVATAAAPGVAPGVVPVPSGSSKIVPENAETLHPVTLVGRIFPGTAFAETARIGTPPNLTFKMGAVVNGIAYEGMGKSKKEAKKQCAIEVLKAVGVPYNPN